MSGTINIKHGSRAYNPILNFPTSENNLSWSFTEEGDGEIYEITTTNVATLSIGGNGVTLPFVGSIAVTNGNSYSVAIIKTTNGQAAQVSIKSRRAVEKIQSISVPDLGAYGSRYIYVLLNNNTVLKFDSQLLLPSNYAGAGVWIVNPIVNTIALPTLPNSAFYSKIKFVKAGGVERFLLVANKYVTSCNIYASYLNVSNDTIYDLTDTTQNGYTNIITISSRNYGALVVNLQYDFIGDIVYIKTGVSVNGQTVIRLNLLTIFATDLGNTSFADFQISSYEHQFSPVDLQFITIGDYSLDNSRNYNYKTFQNNGSMWGYRYRANTRLCTGDIFGKLNQFNAMGVWIGSITYGTVSIYGCTEIYGFDRANTCFMTFNDSYAIVNLTTASSKYRTTDKELASPNNVLLNLRNCHYSNIYVAFCGNSSRVLSTRMLVFKESETNADFGYYDFANTVYSADVNQLLI